MEMKNKVVEFVKTHKKKIVLGTISAVAAIGGIALVAMGKKRSMDTINFSGVFSTKNAKDIQVADWGCGTLDDCWRENGWINAIVSDFTVADAGKLGDELLKIEGVTSETALQTVLSFEDIKVN
jgi:hypothetical protein